MVVPKFKEYGWGNWKLKKKKQTNKQTNKQEIKNLRLGVKETRKKNKKNKRNQWVLIKEKKKKKIWNVVLNEMSKCTEKFFFFF